MSSVQVTRYENEIKNKGLFKYLKAKNAHFKNQGSAFFYTVAAIWPVFGFLSITHKKPDSFIEVVFCFLLGLFPSAMLGALIFGFVSYMGKEFIFRLFKRYRESYNNLIVEQQNFIEMFKDIKNQKIILEFIEWKRKYHLAPVIFHDNKTRSNVDFEKMMVSALAHKNYEFAADLFIEYSDRIDIDNKNSTIELYRNQLESIQFNSEEMEIGQEMISTKKIAIKELL